VVKDAGEVAVVGTETDGVFDTRHHPPLKSLNRKGRIPIDRDEDEGRGEMTNSEIRMTIQ
jgi:hypothetical protein